MSTKISGNTQLIGLIANPAKHSLSPLLHNSGFSFLDLDFIYMAFEVEKDGLEDSINAIRSLKMKGANISTPYKQAVVPFLDKISQAASLIGAVNTIVNDNGILTGHMTDGIGFMKSLGESKVDICGKKITIAGAGGAATAISIQAALDGANEISIFSRKNGKSFVNAKKTLSIINSQTKCEAKLFPLEDKIALKRELEESVLFINGTTIGMKPLENKTIIDDASLLKQPLIVADLVYSPIKTRLLREADAAGCQTINGLGMLLYQASEAFKLWTGKEMPLEEVSDMYFKTISGGE